MSQNSLWRLHTLLAATHSFPFMHYITFLSWFTFYVWDRRGIVTELEKHYMQILKLSNMTEAQLCELYIMLKLDLKIRHRQKKILCLLFFQSMLPNIYGHYILNKSSLGCKELHCSLTMMQIRENLPKNVTMQIAKVNRDLV